MVVAVVGVGGLLLVRLAIDVADAAFSAYWRVVLWGCAVFFPLAAARAAFVLFATLVNEPADTLDFFAWHLLDAIPAVDITHTLRWKQPLGDEYYVT